jgi:iron complex outermembrane receptor protein
MTTMNLTKIASLVLVTASWLPGVAIAQSQIPPAAAAGAASQNDSGDIVVTASKRGNQTVQSTPIAIQALSGELLTAKGAIEFSDFAGSISGLQFDDLGPGDKKYIIRGVSSTGAATVGVYYDEAVITASNSNDGGGRNADIRLFDLERIEVLKGPQGTLYGASSMSGTIRYITNKPSLKDFSGTVTGEVSGTEGGGANYLLHGTLNVPIVTDRLGLRVTGWLDDKSGYVDQPRIPSGGLHNVNTDRTNGGRAILRWVPVDDLVVTGSATIQSTKANGSSRYTPPGSLSFGNAGAGFPKIPGGDLINTDIARSPWDELLHVYGLTAEYTTPIGLFTATTNYFDRRIHFVYDSSPILFFFGVPIPAATIEPQDRSVWSNEIRYASKFAGPINFVVGGFFQQERSNFEVQVIRTDNFGNPAGPFSRLNADDALQTATGNTFFGRTDNQRIDQEAAFGEITGNVTSALSGTFGVRYFHSKQTADQETTHPFGGFSGSPVGVLSNTSSDSKTTLKFNVAYKPNRDFLAYFTAAQGFRVGGVNAANLPFTSNIPKGYTPDTLWNYELGVKTTLAHRIRANLTGYVIDWSDTQVRSVDKTGAFPFTTNAGSVQIKGVEAEVEGRIARGLEVSFAGSYQDAILQQDQPFIPGNPNLGRKGDRLPNVPEWQASASLSYTAPIKTGLDAVLRADMTYRDRTKTQFNPASPFNVGLKEYASVNLRAGVTGGNWSAAVFVRNLTNVRAQIDAIASNQDPLARITIRPRTWGATVTRNF